jgi:hypothetical protein
MAQQLINIGQAPNDKSGDLLRTAFNKINENFTELYGAQNNSYTRTTTANITIGLGVVWTSLFPYISSAKLIIQIEATEVGDATGWHSQVCEAVIASRGFANGYGDPVMTVYGVTYTSTQPLVTFSVRRNIQGNIEVVGTTTVATLDSPALRIHSVEISTRD